MDVCEWLNSVKKLDRLIEAKKEERERLISIATDISPGLPDGMPHSKTGAVPQKMQNAICALVDLDRETEKLIIDYIDHKKKILDALENLPEKEYAVLHGYYIRHMTIEAIAENMGYSERQIKRIKKNGLKILQDVLECHPKTVI